MTRCSNPFPRDFTSPITRSYLREDLDRLAGPAFAPAERYPAYFSKVLSWRRGPATVMHQHLNAPEP